MCNHDTTKALDPIEIDWGNVHLLAADPDFVKKYVYIYIMFIYMIIVVFLIIGNESWEKQHLSKSYFSHDYL